MRAHIQCAMEPKHCHSKHLSTWDSILNGLLVVQSVDISSQIRRTFNSKEGLSGCVDNLPVDERFKLANVKAVRINLTHHIAISSQGTNMTHHTS